MLRRLAPVLAAAPGKPEGANAEHPMREVTRQVAFEPGGWTAERREKVVELFDALAPEWHTKASTERTEPVMDALERGGPFPRGCCVEVGSGIGLLSGVLTRHFDPVVAVDVSIQMLRLARPEPPRVLADGAELPLPDATATALVLVNAFLFPAEAERVLAGDGAVVWVSTLGDRTPIHLSAEEVDRALGGRWDGVASDAGWGSWAVFRKPT